MPLRPAISAAADESKVRPLVHAAETSGWKAALHLLYFHGTLLALTEEIGLPVLVSLRGETHGLEEVSQLLKARTSAELGRILRSWLKEVVPALVKEIEEKGDGASVAELAAAMGARLAAQGGTLPKPFQDAIRRGFEDAVSFSGGIAALAFEFLVARRTTYLTNVLPEPTYERMVRQLEKLGLVEPRLEVSICPSCHNHYFVISSYPITPGACTKCGRPWVTAELFVFSKAFSEAELGSSLMALFISAFLRQKVNSQSPMIDLEVFPNAEFRLDGGINLEMDVYVPRAALAYECKAFEDVFAPLTPSRLGTVTARVLEQIRRYSAAGVQNYVVATNLTVAGAQRVERELQKRLKADQLELTSLKVLPGDPGALIDHLNQTATALAGLLNQDYGESFRGGGTAGGGEGPKDAPPSSDPASNSPANPRRAGRSRSGPRQRDRGK